VGGRGCCVGECVALRDLGKTFRAAESEAETNVVVASVGVSQSRQRERGAMDASERRDAALARPPDPTSRVPLLSPTSLGWDPERLAAHLHHHSFAIAQAPSSLASDATTDARDAARAFFARDAASKRATSRGGGSSEGYSAAEGGTHECFEVRASTSEVPSFRRLYDALEAIARACVADLETHLGIPRGSDDGLAALLDRRAAGGGDETAGDDDDDASLTAMRVLHYRRRDALAEADASSLAASGLGDHTDSSILTVAPRSSLRAGLEVAPYAPRGGGGENGSASAGWIDVEARMTDDDVIVFAGDALAAATWNYFPAALHRPRVEWTREEAAAAPRVSCPFFLRPRADAALDAKALASPALASRVAGIASGATTACLAIDLERNADDVRRSWPWRSERGFYGGVVFAEEEVVVDVVDGGKVVGSVRVPNGVSPEEFIEQSRRYASGMRIGVDGVGTGGDDADAADAEEGGDGGFWTRAKRATAAGTDRKRLHHLPWSADEYVKCVALNAPAAFTADEGSDRGWRELVDHDVVTLTDMSADAAAAAAAAAAASVFDDSDDDDDDKEEEDEAGREKSGELHEIIRVDPPASATASSSAITFDDDASDRARWLCVVEGSVLCATCDSSAAAADASSVDWPTFAAMDSSRVARARPGDAVFVPGGHLLALVAEGDAVATVARRTTTALGSSASAGDAARSAALRAHARTCAREERRAAMLTCGVSLERWEKYAEAVELLWACN
jgi:isopenicillin N synthase-like dioxygenase